MTIEEVPEGRPFLSRDGLLLHEVQEKCKKSARKSKKSEPLFTLGASYMMKGRSSRAESSVNVYKSLMFQIIWCIINYPEV